jgi:hypothetical protein
MAEAATTGLGRERERRVHEGEGVDRGVAADPRERLCDARARFARVGRCERDAARDQRPEHVSLGAGQAGALSQGSEHVAEGGVRRGLVEPEARGRFVQAGVEAGPALVERGERCSLREPSEVVGARVPRQIGGDGSRGALGVLRHGLALSRTPVALPVFRASKVGQRPGRPLLADAWHRSSKR